LLGLAHRFANRSGNNFVIFSKFVQGSPLRLQPQLDQAADSFGATDLCILHSDPGINSRNLLIVHTYDLRSTGDGILHNAAE
jgi:hypothetical protein